MHWFLYTQNGLALCVHKTVSVGANLHLLNYNVPLFILPSVNTKKIRQGYAQHKGFGCFDWYQQVGWRLIKVDNWDNIAESDFTF